MVINGNCMQRLYTAACKKCNTIKTSSELNEICNKCQLYDILQSSKVSEPPLIWAACAAPSELMLKVYK